MKSPSRTNIFRLTVAAGVFLLGINVYAGSLSRNVTFKGASGNTKAFSHSQIWNTDNGRFNRVGTHTGPNGNTITNNVEMVSTENGIQRNSVLTGPDGESINRNGNIFVDHETNTLSRDVAYSDEYGNSHTVSNTQAFSVENGVYTRTGTHSDSNGNSVSNTVEITQIEDGIKRTSDIAGREVIYSVPVE